MSTTPRTDAQNESIAVLTALFKHDGFSGLIRAHWAKVEKYIGIMERELTTSQARCAELEKERDGWQDRIRSLHFRRKSFHDTYNGGHRDEVPLEAFHHGMDTVFNWLESFEKDIPESSTYSQNEVLSKCLAEMKIRCSELEKDEKRFAWLNDHVEAYGTEDIQEGNRWSIEGPFYNLRQAIDAAMKEAK
jgi:hypothetical protein